MRVLLEKYNNVSNGVQHFFLFLVVVFTAGMTYSVMSADIVALQDSKKEMKSIVTGIKREINTIKTEQAVAAERFKGLQKEQKDFRKRTDKGLERILKRLNK